MAGQGSDDVTRARRAVAEAAVAMVEDGMRLGLGTGSTAALFVDALGARVAEGLTVTGVPTSAATAEQAGRLGIPLASLDDLAPLDVTFDGADEIDGALGLIKGGGGALLREKLVASASRRLVVLGDWNKRVETLGRFALPVEIVRFGAGTTEAAIRGVLDAQGLSGAVVRRTRDGAAFVTDEGHEIVDLHLGRISEPAWLADALVAVPGVVETGLFLGLASTALIGRPDGTVETLGR
ncbi:MAG: ribose-5-phosphate isomerase RpiA [Paracoccaceae bacterium]